MTVNAVEVETQSGKPVMLGFQKPFSLGGFVGVTVMTLALSARGPSERLRASFWENGKSRRQP